MKLLTAAGMAFAIAIGLSCTPSGGTENASQKSSSTEEPEVMSAEMQQVVDKGEAIYGQYCVACHQTDGQGMSGAFPPLTKSDWVEGDKTRLISVLVNGLKGPITVNGEEYNNVMPSHSFLSDEDIAAVLTYVRQSFGNSAGEITVAEVADVRASAESDTSTN